MTGVESEGRLHESSAWQVPSISYLYEKVAAGEEVDALAEMAATVRPPELVEIFEPQDSVDPQTRKIIFTTAHAEYAYAEELIPGLNRSRPYDRVDTRPQARYIWGDYNSEDDAAEAIRLDCASRLFLRQFFVEPFDGATPEQNAWRIRQALNPVMLSTISDVLKPHTMSEGYKYYQVYALGIRVPAMRNLILRINRHIHDVPEEADSMLGALGEAARDLASNEVTLSEAMALHAALSDASETSNSNLSGRVDVATRDKFSTIAQGILIESEQQQERLMQTVAHRPFEERFGPMYEAMEEVLSRDPNTNIKEMLIASTDILSRLLNGVGTTTSQSLSKLISKTAEISGGIGLGTYIKLANMLSPNLAADIGENLRELDEATIRDLPQALDRISRVALNSLSPSNPQKVQALESLAHCARLAASIGVDRKMGQTMLTIGDIMVRYQEAPMREQEYLFNALRSGKSEAEIHAISRGLSSRRKHRTRHNIKRPGYGMLS